jgi:2-polyprenyl-6-methoxyphenol hydroxylase-like FAD-dependent oxidoreductase
MSYGPMNPPVIIIGAGPGGLIMALTLSLYGIPYMLVEKTEKRSPFTKALTLQPRTLEILDGFHLLEQLLPRGNLISKTHLWKNGSRINAFDYTDLPSRCNYLLSITQPEVEKTLESALISQGGIIHRGIECVDLLIEDNGCQVTLQNVQTGTQEKIYSSYVIAADGGRSRIRSLLLQRGLIKLKKQGRYDTNFIMGDFTIPNYPFHRNERQTFFGSQTLCTFIPMIFPDVRVVAFGLKKATDSEPLTSEFHDIIKRVANQHLDLTKGQWLNRFYPARFIVNSLRVKSLFFVGDAGHIISPIGAQGINLSIEDAYNLGWKLGMILRKKANHSLLNSYHTERTIAAETVLKETNTLHKDLSNTVRHFFFMHKLSFLKNPEINHSVLLKQTQFFIDYANNKSPTSRDKPSPFYKGMRLIDESSLFHNLPITCFTLILNPFSKIMIEEIPAKILPSFCVQISIKLIISNTKSHLYRRLQQSAPYLLIRPDRYIMDTYTNFHEAEKAIQNLEG